MTGKSEIDLEAEYNNRARVPDHPAVMARWKAGSEKVRAAHLPATFAYGPGPREVMDLFEAGDGAPWAVFLHGGYWQALDKDWFSFVAGPLVAKGVSVAIPSYGLAPVTPLRQIISHACAAVKAMTERAGRAPVVFGHSAGGHMAAWAVAEGLTDRAVAISGVFELEPLVPTSLNAALGLDLEGAGVLSARHRSAPAGAVLDCIAGGAESPEFIRQSRDMAAAWAGQGAVTRFEALTGLDHFTVLDPLFDPESAVVRRLAELARG